jgi:hypothetical protein
MNPNLTQMNSFHTFKTYSFENYSPICAQIWEVVSEFQVFPVGVFYAFLMATMPVLRVCSVLFCLKWLHYDAGYSFLSLFNLTTIWRREKRVILILSPIRSANTYIHKSCDVGFSVCLLRFVTMSSYRRYANSVLQYYKFGNTRKFPSCFCIQIFQDAGLPVPVASRSKVWICDRLPAEIMGSNPAGAWMFAFNECCVLSLRRADHLSRGVLPTAMRRCVWYRNLKNEEAMANVGSQRHRGNKNVRMVVRDFLSNKRCGSPQKRSVKLRLYRQIQITRLATFAQILNFFTYMLRSWLRLPLWACGCLWYTEVRSDVTAVSVPVITLQSADWYGTGWEDYASGGQQVFLISTLTLLEVICIRQQTPALAKPCPTRSATFWFLSRLITKWTLSTYESNVIFFPGMLAKV